MSICLPEAQGHPQAQRLEGHTARLPVGPARERVNHQVDPGQQREGTAGRGK